MLPGMHVTIFGRTKATLEEAAEEIRGSCRTGSQEIKSVAVDLSDYSQVRRTHIKILLTFSLPI